MQKSDSIGKLAAALAEAQAQMRNPTKDRKNDYFDSKYADLAGVLDAVRGPLAENGLVVIQTIEDTTERGPTINTTMIHSSGEWISDGYTMPAPKKDPQGYGSCITYARRYALAAICGVAQEDDDGNGAGGDEPKRKAPDARQAAQANAPKARTEEQYSSIIAGLTTLGIKEAAQPDLVKKLAGKLSPASYDGAEEVIAGLSRMLDEKVRAEKK
jgi:hypothetical protein